MLSHLTTILLRYFHPRSSVKFWHTPIAAVHYDYPSMKDYYIDLVAKIEYKGPYDEYGIPKLNYFGKVGQQYNPCAVAQWGLGAWQAWMRGDGDAEATFWKAAHWLKDNIRVVNGTKGYWHYEFDFDSYSQTAPWKSALAQGQGISLLLRAALVSELKLPWTRTAQLAYAGMIERVEHGGLLCTIGDCEILEEVVADKPTAILDGMLFAIMGLQDYCYFFSDDRDASKLLERMYKSVAVLLPRYELGYWSRADLYIETPPMPASHFYHKLHIAQLSVLGEISGIEAYASYGERWAKYEENKLLRCKALFEKIKFKIFHY